MGRLHTPAAVKHCWGAERGESERGCTNKISDTPTGNWTPVVLLFYWMSNQNIKTSPVKNLVYCVLTGIAGNILGSKVLSLRILNTIRKSQSERHCFTTRYLRANKQQTWQIYANIIYFLDHQ
jgi:hypothetical protein